MDAPPLTSPARFALAQAVLALEATQAKLATAEQIARAGDDVHHQGMAERYGDRLEALLTDLQRDMGAAMPAPETRAP